VPIAGAGQAGERHYLYIGPLEASEHLELLIAACQTLERPLKIMGTGSQAQRLRSQASSLIEFLGDPAAQSLDQVYANTLAFVYPKLDADFGFAAVEAMGRGIPVIAYQHCGMAEIVLQYRTGMLFEVPTVEGLRTTMQEFERLRFLSQACIDRAQEFSDTLFASRLEWYIAQAIDGLN
jgi:glycosyltransferase involved in cell wall biosynthesis